MNYLLTVSLLLLAISPAYYCLTRYSSNYALNRWLMLIGIAVVFLLPQIELPTVAPDTTSTLQGGIVYLEQQISPPTVTTAGDLLSFESNMGAELSEVPLRAEPIDWIALVYAIGLGLAVLLFLFRTIVVIRTCWRSHANDLAQGVNILPAASSPNQAFTFGRGIYLSEDVASDPDLSLILAHERVHARQLHTVDILLSELFLCIFWFHPIAWWLRARLRANLEYLVDATVVRQTNKKAYQLALVRQSQKTHGIRLALPFSEPSLKARIRRLGNLPRHRLAAGLSTVGLLCWLFVALSVTNGTSFHTIRIPVGMNEAAFNQAAEKIWRIPLKNKVTHPERINDFELYFRRLPTLEEYAQINFLLYQLSHTELSVFSACSGEEGEYLMELGHWLNEPARTRGALREGQLMEYHGILKLVPRTEIFKITADPHNTAGYFTPKFQMTVDLDHLISTIDPEDLASYPTTDGPSLAMNLAARGFSAHDFKPEIADEEIAVFVNGERFPLETESTTLFSELNKPLPKPPNVRLQCHLGGETSMQNIHVHTRKNGQGAVKRWVKRELREVRRLERPVHYYYNDTRVGRKAFLLFETSGMSTLQVGYHKKDDNTPIIVQLIDDIVW